MRNQHNSKYPSFPILNYSLFPFVDSLCSIHLIFTTDPQFGYGHSSIFKAFYQQITLEMIQIFHPLTSTVIIYICLVSYSILNDYDVHWVYLLCS